MENQKTARRKILTCGTNAFPKIPLSTKKSLSFGRRGINIRLFNIATFICYSLLILSCSHERGIERLSRNDSISVIQTVLNDKKLTKEAERTFGQAPLKLTRLGAIKSDYNLNFNGEKVEIILSEGVDLQTFSDSSKQLVVSVPMFKVVSPDTIRFSMVLYPGNATFLYTLLREEDKWVINSCEYGKL